MYDNRVSQVMLKAQILARTPKLSNDEAAQYLHRSPLQISKSSKESEACFPNETKLNELYSVC